MGAHGVLLHGDEGEAVQNRYQELLKKKKEEAEINGAGARERNLQEVAQQLVDHGPGMSHVNKKRNQ